MNKHSQFPSHGIIDVDFIDEIASLYQFHYPRQFSPHDPEPFRIAKDVTLRGINLVSCNMRQFLLLFDSSNAPKLSALGRQIIVVSPDQQQGASNNKYSSDDNGVKQNKRKKFTLYLQL